MFARLLVPTDFSPSADAALALARDHFPGARVCLLHVLEPQRLTSVHTGEENPSEQRERLSEDIHAQLEQRAAPGDEQRTVIGTAPEAILETAAQWRADLIVMGTHGRTGLAHFVNGSVAERVARRARCPVLIAHEGSGPAAPTDAAA